ncbi:MAG: AEC family transporter [Victivallales bacterium]|nr:AEC family transporter [Victivallales bacterium]
MLLGFFLAVLGVLAMALPGFISMRSKWLTEDAVSQIARFQVNCVYPCLIFSSIYSNYGMQRMLSSIALPAGSFMIMLCGYIVGMVAVRLIRNQTRDEKKSFVFQCLINNYSYLPMPLVDLLYGPEGVAALLLSTLGAELAVWTLGVTTLSGEKIHLSNLRRLLSPPLAALYLAVILRLLTDTLGITDDWVLSPNTSSALNRALETMRLFGQATIPIAMTVAGARLAMINFAGVFKPRVILLSALRLVIIPLLAFPLINMLPLSPMEIHVLVVVSTMPVAIASFLLSEVYGGDRHFISTTAASTHIFSLATVPLMLFILQKIGETLIGK